MHKLGGIELQTRTRSTSIRTCMDIRRSRDCWCHSRNPDTSWLNAPQRCRRRERRLITWSWSRLKIRNSSSSSVKSTWNQDTDFSKTTQEIIPGLYFGPLFVAESKTVLSELKITHIVTVMHEVPTKVDTIKYLHCDILDRQASILPYFEQIIDFVSEALKNEGRVFIHCSSGISRSGTATIAVVMSRLGINLLESYKLVSTKRPVVCPNDFFFPELCQWKKKTNWKNYNGAKL